MRTAPVRAGCTGATPAFHGQRAWTGNPPQTAIDRKPLQTDKLTGRAFDDEVYAVVAQIPAGKIVSYKQIPADRHARPRPPRRPRHGLRPGRTPLPSRGQQRRAHRPRLAAATGIARKGRRSLQGQRLRRRRPLHVGGNPVTRIAPAPRPEPASGAATGRAPGTPPGRSFAPPAGHDRPAGRGNISPEKIWHSAPKPLSSQHPAVRDGQYSPPGMRLPGKSTA